MYTILYLARYDDIWSRIVSGYNYGDCIRIREAFFFFRIHIKFVEHFKVRERHASHTTNERNPVGLLQQYIEVTEVKSFGL